MLQLVLSLIFISSAVYGQSCPNGYIRHDKSCYAVVTNPTATWPHAQAYCDGANGHLVTFETEAERSYVHNYIQNRFGPTNKYYWIGGVNYIDGSWVWMNNLTAVNLNWATGEPTRNSNEHCLLMVATEFGKYADNTCEDVSSQDTNHHPYVCEKEVS
ncbi:hypothetical protein LOTGIDRAFT_234170 [Lottia gigantea]|uniref:C-type lectin domain-containing protein n=1 Tax=Lottia gigantea TaxID=225164 RepID=V4A466_LOTGI|nr:hypothetical protein LOTGIDRAFT_234170 [Lottia gigantea]ESO89785.1 hypothetical protein LOTGIDRAFT_234170 [Lottia gigantea]